MSGVVFDAVPAPGAGDGAAATQGVVMVPQWPVPPGVHAVFTTRQGGMSAPPFDGWNLGDHVGDDPAHVARNRQQLQACVQAQTPNAAPVFLSQVHGVDVVHLEAGMDHGLPADACLSTEPGPVCTIMVADCLPVLMTTRCGRVVAAAHAGWRGLAQGVIEATLAAVRQAHAEMVALPGGAEPAGGADVLVWLGPCIGPAAFEVGLEVREAFCAADAGAQAFFTPACAGKCHADLAGLARRRLALAGVSPEAVWGNDSSDAWCTVSQPSRFFSHRRDSAVLGGSGRMAACIWRG